MWRPHHLGAYIQSYARPLTACDRCVKACQCILYPLVCMFMPLVPLCAVLFCPLIICHTLCCEYRKDRGTRRELRRRQYEKIGQFDRFPTGLAKDDSPLSF
jgi:hypothetical protein